MHETPNHRRGRGAKSNRSGRYDVLQRIDSDDGWQQHIAEETSLRTQWREDSAKTVITRNQSPDIHFDRSINPYRGCEHGCVYCFARPTHTYLGHSAGLDFERLLYAKQDAAELLKTELGKPGYQCQPIAVGVNTDAYQPLERKLGITRKILKVLLEYQHPVYLITKSALIERDIDLLQEFAKQQLVTVALSVTTLDNQLAHRLEPRAAAPHKRLRVMRTMADAGIPTRVSMSPLIPALNEHEIESVMQQSADHGASSATVLLLRLSHELGTLFSEWLDHHYPLKKTHILNALKEMRGNKTAGNVLNNSDFGQRFTGAGPRAELIQRRFELACKKYGLASSRGGEPLDITRFTAPVYSVATDNSDDQLDLFT